MRFEPRGSDVCDGIARRDDQPGGGLTCERSEHGRRDRSRGVALVEGAIVFPVVFLALFGIIESGIFFATSSTTNNAARDGARYGASNFATAVEPPDRSRPDPQRSRRLPRRPDQLRRARVALDLRGRPDDRQPAHEPDDLHRQVLPLRVGRHEPRLPGRRPGGARPEPSTTSTRASAARRPRTAATAASTPSGSRSRSGTTRSPGSSATASSATARPCASSRCPPPSARAGSRRHRASHHDTPIATSGTRAGRLRPAALRRLPHRPPRLRRHRRRRLELVPRGAGAPAGGGCRRPRRLGVHARLPDDGGDDRPQRRRRQRLHDGRRHHRRRRAAPAAGCASRSSRRCRTTSCGSSATTSRRSPATPSPSTPAASRWAAR